MIYNQHYNCFHENSIKHLPWLYKGGNGCFNVGMGWEFEKLVCWLNEALLL